mmetsp:Transcript_15356/g.35586  ORF Transcript_15356/g.35586 Transcript_15356/m.35586 type:complete len:245 (+) Transcript_15356:2539-3273(+)
MSWTKSSTSALEAAKSSSCFCSSRSRKLNKMAIQNGSTAPVLLLSLEDFFSFPSTLLSEHSDSPSFASTSLSEPAFFRYPNRSRYGTRTASRCEYVVSRESFGLISTTIKSICALSMSFFSWSTPSSILFAYRMRSFIRSHVGESEGGLYCIVIDGFSSSFWSIFLLWFDWFSSVAAKGSMPFSRLKSVRFPVFGPPKTNPSMRLIGFCCLWARRLEGFCCCRFCLNVTTPLTPCSFLGLVVDG